MRKWLVRGGLIAAGVILLLAGILVVAYRLTVTRSLPSTDGTRYLRGISEPVEIIRDTHGVPHILAHNEPDLYFAMGYAMAQDRLWQMEFFRRLGQGRLAEIFGPDLVSIDRYFRTIAAGGVAQPVGQTIQPLMEAFAAGINAFLLAPGRVLPLEFRLLGYRPEPWRPLDYMAVLRLMTWQLSMGWKVDITAARIKARVGAQKLREAFPTARTMIPAEPDPAFAELIEALAGIGRLHQRIEQWTGITPMPASNNWVVSGRKTASGRPLLANDAHMGLNNPSLWWEVHLVCPTLQVSGFTVAGLPGIVMGNNANVAWSITAVMSDDVDYYIERLNPQNDRQYRFQGRWEDFEIVTETIRVKGRAPETAQIRIGRNGVVLESDWPDDNHRVITARWTFNERPIAGLSAYRLIKAVDVEDVIAALREWEQPALNFVFADIAGNIGYWCCAAIPIRTAADGLLPKPGWTGRHDWQGFIPFDERPHAINPPRGYLASANHNVTPADYPYHVSGYWAPEDRIGRIRALLEKGSDMTVDDMRRMQQDIFCPLADDIVPELVRVMQHPSAGPKVNDIADMLSGWDRRMAAESPAACVFDTVVLKLLQNIFADEMGEDLYRSYLDMVVIAPRALRGLFNDKTSGWWDDVSTPQKESPNDIIGRSAKQAVSDLTALLGRNPARWRWGDLHTLTFTHVMGKRGYLDRILNLGPYAVGGSHLTVNKFVYDYNRPYGVTDGVSQRMIVDLGRPMNALHVLPTGQSGHLASPHYDDQIPLFLGGRYHPVWTEPEQLKAHTEARLVLLPASD